MRGLTRKVAAVAAIISLLSVSAPQAAFAETEADYVPAGSCADEVARARAVISAEQIATALATPWVYRYDSAGSRQSPREMLAYAKMYKAAGNQLVACAYRTAAASMDARVRVLAPNGLPHRVTQADCVGEQAAYAAAYHQDSRTAPEGMGRELAAGFVEGVAYNDVLYNNGRGMTRDDYYWTSRPPRVTGMAKHDAGTALQACVYGVAYQRGGGTRDMAASNAPVNAPSAPADPCVNDLLATVNNELTDVEARLERFLSESQYVKAEGSKTATPMLQVTMWGLERSVAVLKKHCPASAMAKERIAQFESSLKHAKAACDQIQAGGRKCVATEPEQVM